MKRMRVFLLGLTSGLVALSAGAQSKVDKGLQLNADGSIRIYALAGSVRIVGWSRDSVAVRGTLGKGNSFHMGGGKTGMKMFVESVNDRDPAPANIEISVPVKSKLWVKTATAGIDVSGVTGSLDLYVVSGTIRVDGNPADVNAEAIDGDIRITGSPTWVRAKSASGVVSLRGTSSDVSLSTVSGGISVDGGRFERAKFETVTGNIMFAGSFEKGGLVNFDTHSGTIQLRVPSAASGDFDVVSIAGAITNKLTSRKPVPGRYGRGAELTMTSNDGGARIAIRTFKGAVTLVRSD